jgi:hypothetical protein
VSFGALFDRLSAPKVDPGKYLRSPWSVAEKCITCVWRSDAGSLKRFVFQQGGLEWIFKHSAVRRGFRLMSRGL